MLFLPARHCLLIITFVQHSLSVQSTSHILSQLFSDMFCLTAHSQGPRIFKAHHCDIAEQGEKKKLLVWDSHLSDPTDYPPNSADHLQHTIGYCNPPKPVFGFLCIFYKNKHPYLYWIVMQPGAILGKGRSLAQPGKGCRLLRRLPAALKMQ